MKELEVNLTMFDSIKHIDLDGNEYWSARELQKVLGYKRWDKFNNVINDAKTSCKNSNNNDKYHFSQVGKMIIDHIITFFTSFFCILYYIIKFIPSFVI